jgi:hypothetical protein
MTMMDSPAYVSPEALARVRAAESSEGSVITIEPTGFTSKQFEFLGVAILDERYRGDIHNGRRTEFRVEAGEHTVSVHIKRRFRVGAAPDRANVSLPVVVEPGEHLDLVFGVAREWLPLQRGGILWLVLLLVEVSLVVEFAVGWSAFPVVRRAFGWVTLSMGIWQRWAVLTIFAFLLGAQVSLWNRFGNSSGRSGGPYFLRPRSDIGKPLPALKAQYVEPFE